MAMDDTKKVLLLLPKRAETSERSALVETFVDSGSLLTLLSSKDHQIIYGRRGTGKTHALLYLHEKKLKEHVLSVFFDMRTIGSSSGLFSDSSLPAHQRALHLLRDTITKLQDEVVNFLLTDENANLAITSKYTDMLLDACTQIVIDGDTLIESVHENQNETTASLGVRFIASKSPSLLVNSQSSAKDASSERGLIQQIGTSKINIRFGDIGPVIGKIVETLPNNKLFILIDEWSSVPLDLQPYLAEMMKRCFLPVSGVTVKIAAIEQRTNIAVINESTHLGMEVGADIAADMDLDDFMVFDNDEHRSQNFFGDLIYNHYNVVRSDYSNSKHFADKDGLINAIFTQQAAFAELVRAAEGVPRDAINLLALAIQRSGDDNVSIEHVRSASKAWYMKDKDAAVSSNPEAKKLLNHIIDEVIAHRKARAFLLKSGQRYRLVNELFDARVLHVRKRNVSSNEQPGVRYDVYKIDYGCYVDLQATSRSPQGGFFENDGGNIAVPADDYRSIRRAILDLD